MFLFYFTDKSSVQNTNLMYMRISRILLLQCKTFFVDLYAYFMLSHKTQTCSAKRYIKNRLDYYLSTIL